MPAVVFPGSGLMLLRRQRSPLGPAFPSGLGPSETAPAFGPPDPCQGWQAPGSEHRLGLGWGDSLWHGRATPWSHEECREKGGSAWCQPELGLVNADSFGALTHPCSE